MKRSYTKKQITEAIKYWTQYLNESTDVPEISSIKEFLDLCKKDGNVPEKKRVAKQGKVVSARLANGDETITSREGKETPVKGSLIVDDADGTQYAVQPEDIPSFYEVDDNGNSATGDNTKWKKRAMTLDYYITPFDVDIKVSWQQDPLHATAGYSIVVNNKEGTNLSPVAPDVFKDKTLWKPLGESCAIKLTESEDMFSFDSGIGVFSARNMIFAATPDDVECAEYSRYSDSFGGFVADERTMAHARQTAESDTYRAIAYWQKPYLRYDPRTGSAFEVICELGEDSLEDGYNAFVNKDFYDYDEDWDETIADFVSVYPTFAAFNAAVRKSTVTEFLSNLSGSDCDMFRYVTEHNVKVLPNGMAYLVILWRA